MITGGFAHDLYEQVRLIEASQSLEGMPLYPCALELLDGRVLNCAYVVSASDCKRFKIQSGSAEEGDSRWVAAVDVGLIRESPMRLPAKFAGELRRAGESGMGYWVFTVVFSWFRRREYVQSFVDFIEYPDGKGPDDVKKVIPHKGRREVGSVSSLEVYWCVFDFFSATNSLHVLS